MKKMSLVLFFSMILSLHTAYAQHTMSPAEYLGYELGERVTFHHKVVAYFEHVAASSPNVRLEQYGHTYSHRPLFVAFISSEENLDRLDEIRTNNLIRARLLEGTATDLPSKALVWLSYNVHGNEISATEAAMLTLYELVTKEHASAWLENTVVIMDPVLNPDGRDRYAFNFHQVVGKQPDPYPTSREHIEPWPGGRSNHYQFDLNRDWAWQIQRETRQRIALYHKWMPHIHADFHEMGINSPYYFAPAAEPLHESITQWQREFQVEIGRNHARYFDANFERYYTRENFDLFYPSYGDTYPTYNGAIGMTYEQAGNTRGGIAVKTPDGDLLTLDGRTLNQHVAGMSTVEVTSKHADRVAAEFFNFFRLSESNPYSPYKTYIIKAESGRDKLNLVTSYLDKWEIQYGHAPARRGVSGTAYKTGANERFDLTENDLIISAHQPKSVLLNVLFEPRTTIIDSLTYDITAWGVPYAMGLKAFATTTRINPAGTWTMPEVQPVSAERYKADRPYAYVVRWQSVEDVRFLASMLKQDIRVRFAMRPFEIDGQSFAHGTLVIMRRGNEQHGRDFDRIVTAAANEFGREILPTTTGMVTRGIDFGSDSMFRIHAPKVALFAGRGVSSTNFGEIWHFFDQQIDYPISIFNIQELNMVNLSNFDVIIMPEGWYQNQLSQGAPQRIGDWVRAGGNLIVIGRAINNLPMLGDLPMPETRTNDNNDEPNLIRFEDQSRESISDFITGAIYRVKLDNSHPLAFGYPDYYYTLKSGNAAFEFMQNGWNVGRLHSNSHLSGFQGYRVAERINDTLIFGVQSAGQGSIVYMVDNPMFRGFWHNGKLLFANAVFFINQEPRSEF